MRAVLLHETVSAQRAKRSKAWQNRRRAKLREVAKRNPKLIDDAIRLGQIREEFARDFAGREISIVAELRAEGFSLWEIGYTVYMGEQQVTKVLRRWRKITS